MPSFTIDDKISKIAEAYSLDAVDMAARNFKTKLDWTDDSIALVEGILAKLHGSLSSGQRPPEDTIWKFAKAFGSYVGEVFRKNHGGDWGMVTHDGQTFPGARKLRDTTGHDRDPECKAIQDALWLPDPWRRGIVV
jgi:hypothetical protein